MHGPAGRRHEESLMTQFAHEDTLKWHNSGQMVNKQTHSNTTVYYGFCI